MYLSTFELLLKDNRVDPSIKGSEAVLASADRNNPEILNILLSHPSVNASKLLDPFLQISIEAHAFKNLLFLAKYHAIEIPPVEINAPLTAAIQSENLDFITYILSLPESRFPKLSASFVFQAISSNKPEIACLLITSEKLDKADPSQVLDHR